MSTHTAPDRANRWRDLRTRALSTLVMIPAAIGAILAGGIIWQFVLGALTAGAVFEWASLSAPTPKHRAAGTRAVGFLYITLAYVALLFLRASRAGAANVLFVAITVAAGDIGAYLAGRLIGGPKLAPSLSPGKTRSGAIGGLIAGIAAGTVFAATYTPHQTSLLTAAALAACLSVVAQAGDLLESAMKRRFGKKDSSNLIPGHGGLLDRLDGLLAAAPGGGSLASGPARCLSMAVKTVTVLGSTGSIGRSTADLLAANMDKYRVLALVGNRNAKLLAAQARALNAELAVCADPAMHAELRAALAGTSIRIACGQQAVLDAARLGADWTMAAITGIAGLAPTLAAAEAGHVVALANKEALVSAGDVMLRAVADAGATLLPVDSEHNAIFQALAGSPRQAVEKIVLTASGGPFRLASREEMAAATPEMAARHPVWTMGAKITIDSATLFNKGLEVIEAARLFDLTSEEIDVLVHPQSTVHGLVYFADGSVLAQLGAPDMRIPIAHALAWPDRLPTNSPRLDLATLGKLEFSPPDETRFPALRLARQALRAGGGSPTILNAANEVAVDAFLQRRISFLDIAAVVEAVLDRLGTRAAGSLEAVTDLDAEARRSAQTVFASRAA